MTKTNRNTNRRSCRAIVALAALLCSHSAVANKNVVFIAIDDLRPELGTYGVARAQSPNIDNLASIGTRFERAYCQVAVCGASRVSVMSGCRPASTLAWGANDDIRVVMPDVLSLPQHFSNSGYKTATLGKVYHGLFDDIDSYNVSANSIVPYQPPLSSTANNNLFGYTQTLSPSQISFTPAGRRGPATEIAAPGVGDGDYEDGEAARRAVGLIESFAADPNQPFFLAVGFRKPHLPFNAPREYWDLYDRDEIAVPDRENMENVVLQGVSSWKELRNYSDIANDSHKTGISDAQTRELIHGYLACVSYIDALVGKVVDALEDNDLMDDTTIVLWGDHGFYLGEFGDWAKHTNYEIATRVPLIIYDPDHGGNQVTDGLTELVDLYPTVCDLSGIATPGHCQGVSLAPLLNNPNRDWKGAAYSQFFKKSGGQEVLGTTVRTNRYRFTEWRQSLNNQLLPIQRRYELVDFENDPDAKVNVAREAGYADTIDELKKLIDHANSGVEPGEDAFLKPVNFSARNGSLTYGKITANQAYAGQWRKVNFPEVFDVPPVVVLSSIGRRGGDPVTARVRNVSRTSFDFQVDEWDYLDGVHGEESFGWIAMKPGVYQIDGKTWDVGRIEGVTGEGQWKSFTSGSGFGSSPVVLTQITSWAPSRLEAATARIGFVSNGGFSVRIDEEEANDGIRSGEQIGYIAMQTGDGTEGRASFRAGKSQVTHRELTLDLERNFGPNVAVFANIQSRDERDPATVRLNMVNNLSAGIFLEEEKSADNETLHLTETVGWLALEL